MAIMAQPWKSPNGIYYFRREVPAAIRDIIGKREWKVSLGSKDLATVRTRFTYESNLCEEAFAAARAQLQGRPIVVPSDAPKVADRWARNVLKGWETSPENIHEFLAFEHEEGVSSEPKVVPASDVLWSQASREGHDLMLTYIRETLLSAGLPVPLPEDPASTALRQSFWSRWHDLCRMAHDRYLGNWGSSLKLEAAERLTVAEARAVEEAAKLQANETQVGLLSEACDEWTKRKRVTPAPDEKMIGEYKAVIEDFIELHGDLSLDQITDAEVWDFAETLLTLPKTKLSSIRSLPLLEQINLAAEQDLPRVAPATVKKKLRFLGSVISTGSRRCKFKGLEPVAASKVIPHLASIIGRTASIRRMYYTRAELVRIFSSPLFTKQWSPPKADYGEALYWIPLILLYTGARLGEIATLYAEDIKQDVDTGQYYIDITSHKGEPKKTANSIRQIPIHPDLIALGLLDYAANQARGYRLFPKMGDPKKNGRGAYITRAFTEYLQSVVKLEACEAPPLHGLRHSFTTYGAQVGIPQDAREFIQGHRDQRKKVADGYNGRLIDWLSLEVTKFPSIVREAGLLNN